jgi:hypothetical protein
MAVRGLDVRNGPESPRDARLPAEPRALEGGDDDRRVERGAVVEGDAPAEEKTQVVSSGVSQRVASAGTRFRSRS